MKRFISTTLKYDPPKNCIICSIITLKIMSFEFQQRKDKEMILPISAFQKCHVNRKMTSLSTKTSRHLQQRLILFSKLLIQKKKPFWNLFKLSENLLSKIHVFTYIVAIGPAKTWPLVRYMLKYLISLKNYRMHFESQHEGTQQQGRGGL